MKLRDLYYWGIYVLVLYALPNIPYIKTLLDFKIGSISIIAIVAIGVGIGAFQSHNMRFG